MNTVLLRPFLYLRVQHGTSTLPWMNWGLPASLSLAILAVVATVAPNINAFHASGVFDRLLSFVQNLPGFYLAALAAVATFNRASLDQLMPGTPPTVSILYHGKPRNVELTRRRFLALQFAYLTTISFCLTLCLVVGLPLVEHVRDAVTPGFVPVLRMLAASCFVFVTTQMIIITLWGLYYLGERMHTPD